MPTPALRFAYFRNAAILFPVLHESKMMNKSAFTTTAGHIVEAVRTLGLPDDTPVEISVRLGDQEKIAQLNPLLREAEKGEPVSADPFAGRLARLHASQAKA